MSTDRLVTYEHHEAVATVTLDNPPANALSRAVLDRLERTVDELNGNASVKAIVITGAGRLFSAGADVKEIARIRARSEGEELTRRGQSVYNKIEGMGKVVIAAVNGLFCLGGGLELAMACHIRIAGDRVRLGLPEITLGVIPGFGGTQRLPRLVGPAKALELILTGDRITAQEAHQIGLVNQVVPQAEVLDRARKLAGRIGSMGQVAVRAVLSAARMSREGDFEQGLGFESTLFGKLCETADMREGLSAFLEKRPPRFTDG